MGEDEGDMRQGTGGDRRKPVLDGVPGGPPLRPPIAPGSVPPVPPAVAPEPPPPGALRVSSVAGPWCLPAAAMRADVASDAAEGVGILPASLWTATW